LAFLVAPFFRKLSCLFNKCATFRSKLWVGIIEIFMESPCFSTCQDRFQLDRFCHDYSPICSIMSFVSDTLYIHTDYSNSFGMYVFVMSLPTDWYSVTCPSLSNEAVQDHATHLISPEDRMIRCLIETKGLSGRICPAWL